MPRQAVYRNRFSVLKYPEDTGMGQNEWQIYGDSLGTQQQWSIRHRVFGDRIHQAASNFERMIGTMHKAGNATVEATAFQNVQRISDTNT